MFPFLKKNYKFSNYRSNINLGSAYILTKIDKSSKFLKALSAVDLLSLYVSIKTSNF